MMTNFLQRGWILFLSMVLMASCQFDKTTDVHTDPDTGISYHWSGSGDTTLVFIHGWCADGTYWEKQEAYFKERYKVLLLDLPGLGLSEKPMKVDYKSTVPQLLNEIVDQPAVLVGHSLGVDLALSSLELMGDKAIKWVVVDDFKSLDIHYTTEEKKEIGKIITNLKNNFYKIGISFAEESLLDENASQELYKKVVEDIKASDAETAANAMKTGFDFNEERQQLLQKSKVKLHLIESEHVSDVAALNKWNVPYEVHLVRNGGHFPMYDKATTFNGLLSEIITEKD